MGTRPTFDEIVMRSQVMGEKPGLNMDRLRAFSERYPNVTGDDLALAAKIANRLTTADLGYRSMIANGLGLAIWLIDVVFCLGLPLVAARWAIDMVKRWIDSEATQILVILVFYSCTAWMLARFTARHSWVTRTTEKVRRRSLVYRAAIAFKRMIRLP